MESLDWYKKEVHKRGFNISMMINLFKKKQRKMKALYEVPDEVFIEVCKEYFKRGDSVDKTFPYFLAVLKKKVEESVVRKNISDHEKIKNEPVRLKITIG